MTNTLDPPASRDAALAAYNARRLGFAAGVAAAVVMLVAIAMLRVVSNAISLPEIVAEGFLQVLPGALFSSLLDALQRSAKPLLYLGVVVGTLIVGGLLGRWYGDDPRWRRAV